MLVDSVLNTSELSEDAIDNVYPKVYAKDFIAHHGIKGQKWGLRRFQNPDGSLTEAGRRRYSGSKGKEKLRKDFKDDPEGQGKVLKQIASDKREKAVSALAEEMENDFTDIAADGSYLKEKGYVKNNKEAAEYLIKAAQKSNENYDDDTSMFQTLGRELDLYQKGHIDKKTFDALYDARAAEDIMEYGRDSYDWHGEGAKGAVNANKYKSNLNNRLSYWFGDGPSNPEYNPNKPISVSDYEYEDLLYLRELDHSFKSEVNDFLAHHGIKGQKWGNRRYQNPDGSLTDLGRVRYGVGSALKKTGSAVGKAIRKATGRQTDAELDAEVEKAQKRNERRAKQKYIDESKGKRKPLHKMNDDELNEYIDRLTKERNVKRMEKELKEMNRGPAKKMIAGLADNVVSGVGEGVKRGIANTIETSMRKSTERKQNLKDKKFEDKHKSKEEKASEKLQQTKNDSQNKLDIVKNETERKALLGNDVYSKRLEEVAAAKKGNKSSNDYGGKDALAKLEAAEYKMAYQALFSDDAKKRYKAYRDATGRGSGKKKNN